MAIQTEILQKELEAIIKHLEGFGLEDGSSQLVVLPAVPPSGTWILKAVDGTVLWSAG